MTENLSMTELRRLAADLGLAGRSTMTKDELIGALAAAEREREANARALVERENAIAVQLAARIAQGD